MKTISIYKYGNTLTPEKRNDGDTPSYIRIIADDGKVLVNGDERTHSRDITADKMADWHEEDETKETTPTIEQLAARIAAIEMEQVKQNADIEATAAGLTDTITQIMGGAE